MNRHCFLLVGICIMLSVFHVYGQERGTCGEVLLSARARNIQKQNFLRWKAQSTTRSSTLETITIPIVFHFIDNDGPQSVEALERVVDQVNRGFANDGEYATDYGRGAGIRFCLAKSAPDGGVSNGINMVNSRYEDFDLDLELEDFLAHISWDYNRYVNVWVANSIRAEHPLLTLYSGKNWWSRPGLPAFAMPGRGIVLTGLDAGTLIHELGHYFGLLHTFEGFLTEPCKNDDCLVNGDMVCDTPPDRSVTGSCGDNSCDTDTKSNFSNQTFFTDTLDMGTNFMDYGGCPTEFSHGQIDRMRFVIDSTYPDLPVENNVNNQCEQPCAIEAIGIDVSQALIITGQQVAFAPSNSSYDHYEWYVFPGSSPWNEAPYPSDLIATSVSFSHTFSDIGWYTVYVKGWNDPDVSCFTSFARNVLVTCGVDARFSPDKRRNASKQPDSLFTDSVTFVNYSVGATSHEWTVKFSDRNAASNIPDFTSTDQDLTYVLSEPGEYEIQLSATDGACTDLSNTLFLSILDPTMDGSPVIDAISCVNEDSILVRLTLYNYGFDTINVGTPLSFYNGNPLRSTGSTLLESRTLPFHVFGLDELVGYEKEIFSFYVHANYDLLDTVFVVFNDPGTETFPVQFPPADKDVLSTNSQFPPSGQAELTYENNVASYAITKQDQRSFEDITACLGDELMFADSLCNKSVTWNSLVQGPLGQGSEISYVVSGNDQMIVTTESTSGIIASDTFLITVSSPQLEIPEDTYTINKGETAQLQVIYDPTASISWSPATSLDNPFSGTPRASPLVSIDYTATVTDTLGCTTTGQVTVVVIAKGHIPNLFTPNGDGRNDQLLIYGIEGVESFSFKILNRAGNTVYSSTSVEEVKTTGWDGSWNAIEQPSGVFYWSVAGQYEDGSPLLLNNEKTGIIHLVR